MKKVLLTGGAGYLGSILSRKLIEKGYQVKCFDKMYFGESSIKQLIPHKDFELINGDIQKLDAYSNLLDGVNAVIHLAGLANDPTAELDPELTQLINYRSSYLLAKMAKERGVERFIYASSCSVYGKGLLDVVSEETPLNPVSVYAESKMRAENEIIKMVDEKFCPIFLRQATLYGVSWRMRFDLAINLMVLHAILSKKIFIWGGGTQWRPFLHVEDAAEAFITCLEQPRDNVAGKIYNVGSTENNYKIIDLAKIVQDNIKGVQLDIIPDNPDKRSYRVCCDKISKELNWHPRRTIEDGIKELIGFIEKNKQKTNFEDYYYYNIKTLQRFLKTPVIENGDPIRADELPFNRPSIGKEEEEEVLDTLRSGWLTTGPKVNTLEEMFKRYIGVKHAVCVSSCTAALHLSLAVLDIKDGDEVITSPITWPATANVIVHVGATPVFADVNRRTLNIDPQEIESKITKKTKAIIPVHVAGQPCEMDKINQIAKKYNLHVIEDAAHAIGAFYNSQQIGTISDFTCFSFYPIKNITTIEGGLVVTNNNEWAKKLRIYSLHGVTNDAWNRYATKSKGIHEVVYPGFKYNMSDIQASLGIHQLKKLKTFIKQRKEIIEQYNNSFSQIEEIIFPQPIHNIQHANHLYIIILDIDKLKIDRDRFIEALKSENIGVGVHFRSLHMQPYYRNRFSFKDDYFPSAKYLSDRILSLPLYPAMNQRDVDTVIKAVIKLVNYYRK
ncbi:MAG: aminotransferase class I/II-fold pyridoxal phosphate-dependent enzyme [Patescibacteria group bacterium]